MRRSRLTVWIVVAIAYLSLWGATQLVGPPAVRLEGRLPRMNVRAFAVAPFLIWMDYDWVGELHGGHGKSLRLWVGRSFEIWGDRWDWMA